LTRLGERKAFGRIELLVVVAIIVVLFTLYWAPIIGGHRKQARLDCSSNLQKLFVAMQIYGNEQGGRFPAEPGARTAEEPLDKLVPRYTVDTSLFICPASKDAPLPSGESIRHRRISYAYYMGRMAAEPDAALMSDRQVDTQARGAGQIAFSTTGKAPGNNHGERGGNILFADGHVDFSAPQVPFALGLTQGVVLLNPKP
jgi:prepilin-type processing-associated H-X9-DG protein